MVGASFAALLNTLRPDWHIVLIESHPMARGDDQSPTLYQPSFDARSTALASGSVDILRSAGLWEKLKAQACAIEQVHVSDRGLPGGTLIDAKEFGLPAVGQVLENAWMGRVLLSHLQTLENVTVLAPVTVKALTPIKGAAKLTLEDGSGVQSTQVRLAVIADGGDSPLRKRLGIGTRVEDYRQHAIISNVGFDLDHNNIAYERFTDEGPMALLPLRPFEGRQRSALVWTVPSRQSEEVLALPEEVFARRLQDRFGFRRGLVCSVGTRSAYPLQLTEACEQVRSNLVLLGNAAHFLHPVAGQGFNLALRDCANLCAVLAAHPKEVMGNIETLQAYEKGQALDQQATISFSDSVTKVFSRSDLPLSVLRQLGFLGLELLPPGKALFSRQSMGRAGVQAYSAAIAKRGTR